MFIPDPRSWFLPIPDPGSLISDPRSKNSNKRERWKKISCHTFSCSHKFHKIVNYFSFEVLKKTIWADFQRIIELFTKKNVKKLLKIWSWDPGSGKNLFRIPDPGVKKHPIPDPGSRSATLHFFYKFGHWTQSGGGGVANREQRSSSRSRQGGVSENQIAGATAARLFFLTAVAIGIATRPFKFHEISVSNTSSSFVSSIHSFGQKHMSHGGVEVRRETWISLFITISHWQERLSNLSHSLHQLGPVWKNQFISLYCFLPWSVHKHKKHIYRVPQSMFPRRYWDYPTLSPASECAPPPEPTQHTRLRVRSSNSDDWRKSLALCLLCGPQYEEI